MEEELDDTTTNPEGEVEGEGGEEGAGQTVKIGEKEYTTKELSEAVKGAEQYKNLLPDYTRKSQKLAEFEKVNKPSIDDNTPEFLKPGWQPKSYADLQDALRKSIELGQEKVFAKLQAERDAQSNAEKELEGFISEVKKSDKEFSEKEFFAYAKKHEFPITDIASLKSIYSSYKDVRDAQIKGETNALKNRDKRFSAGVSGPKGGKSEGGLTYKEIQRSSGVADAVSRYLNR